MPGLVIMVGLGRLELPTSRLSSARSNQLSYRPLLAIDALNLGNQCPEPGTGGAASRQSAPKRCGNNSRNAGIRSEGIRGRRQPPSWLMAKDQMV